MTTAAIPPHAALRAATADCHERVDATFASFDLADKGSYTAFLMAHARVVPAIESALRDAGGLPRIEPRAVALAADLAALGATMPSAVKVTPPASDAIAWGMLYVIEGSRLGGVFLARGVGADLPKTYLAAGHERGGWKALLRALDAAGEDGGTMWLADAEHAARQVFELYEQAAITR